ncbi:hypothetical protein M441DRAFT_254237 [Trichoderma asperellum CBS 433.97]|uniref:Uncharacterized protein n=1 Tax=Trichoderma asperellum (strain ATCC 204424 / CBS 433.97 / NBRC 101777) TaxID=1042311 RepID=A0A2T3YYH0_TRIA4|nr:hypothetical protein M441DRAFT_254237 [Trichoderma asperellum CBS 433.97]PTB37586.1 hypothetical protein M441DRAFT_254237 [Trichoderma asperellum CBS 433.97]
MPSLISPKYPQRLSLASMLGPARACFCHSSKPFPLGSRSYPPFAALPCGFSFIVVRRGSTYDADVSGLSPDGQPL